jgi:hypothetical protein
MYRMYNPCSGEHLFTIDLNEAKTIATKGWRWEGIGWVVPKTSSTPIYRLYNSHSGDHHFTKDKNEYDTLKKRGWTQEGIAFYSEEANSSSVAVMRLFNSHSKTGTHHYTKDSNEYSTLKGYGWTQEGVAFYVSNKANLPITAFWLVSDSWSYGTKERYWVTSTGDIAKSRIITASEGAGWTAYAKPSGAVVRGKWDNGAGYVYVADNDGRLASTADGKTGWLVTKNYDTCLQRYYYIADKHAMKSSYFEVDGTLYYGIGGQGYVARNRMLCNDNTWYSADNEGKLTVESNPKGKLISALNSAGSSSGISLIGDSGFSLNSAAGKRLQNAVNNLRNKGYSVGFAMIDLTSGLGISSSATQSFYSASTIKGAYVAAINHYSASSTSSYIRGLMTNTILYSSNDAYEALRRTYGGGVMQSQMDYSGVSSFSASSYYCNTSARDFAKLWVGNYWYFYEDTNSNSAWCRSLYTQGLTGTNAIIYNALGSSYTVYAKPGWISEPGYLARNDTGVVMSNSGAYAIAVMSTAYNDIDGLKELVRALDDVHTAISKL